MSKSKSKTHFKAFGYEPLRMKPVHFASGFFLALTGKAYTNELLNKVAVTKAGKGLKDGYLLDNLFEELRNRKLISEAVKKQEVALLRILLNGIVNNDSAMYPAFKPYNPKGNDYTFISPSVLTKGDRTDGFAGQFVFSILDHTDSGKAVLNAGRLLVKEQLESLELFVSPLIKDEEFLDVKLQEEYENKFGILDKKRITKIAEDMENETNALRLLCDNIKDYSHYKKIRYYVIGLLAWVMSYLLKTSFPDSQHARLMFLDFIGKKDGRTRRISKASYARLRKIVQQSYSKLAKDGRSKLDTGDLNFFKAKKRPEELDFSFLESHFNDLALRMGYAQPRASSVPQKHFEFHPDTLRVILLSILDNKAQRHITLDDVCKRLYETWNLMVGGLSDDNFNLRNNNYFEFDEEELRSNTTAFSTQLKNLNMALELSDGLILCSTDIEEIQ